MVAPDGLCERTMSPAATAADASLRAPKPPFSILMVTPRYYPYMGGVEIHTHEVAQRLARRGQSVTILSTDPSRRYPVTELVSGINIIRVKAWPKHGDLYFAPELFPRIGSGEWDIVHVQSYHTLVSPLAMAAAIRNRIPFVITFHSGGHSSRLRNAIRGIQRAALRPLIARAQQLIAVSEFEADLFSNSLGIARARFAVVPNGSRLPKVSDTTQTPSSPLVISIGRLERYKGHHRVIRAFPGLLRRAPDAHLRILGEGPYEQNLRKLVRELSLDSQVTIGGILPSDKQGIASLISSAALVVLMSEYEAHPVAIVEALALGRPVLVSDTSGLREIARGGACRLIPLHCDSQTLADAMAEQLSTPRRPVQITLPDWDDCADRLLNIYQTVVARSQAGEAPISAGSC